MIRLSEGRSQLWVLVAYLRPMDWVPFVTVLMKAELTTREVILKDYEPLRDCEEAAKCSTTVFFGSVC